MPFLKEFYLLRHGETDWTRNTIVMGSSDIPLNSNGKQQIYNSLKTLTTLGIDHIYTSPLLRAYESASIVVNHLSRPLTTIPELKEANMEEREGKTIGDGLWQIQWRDNRADLNGEAFDQITSRISKGLDQILKNPEKPLVVTHGVATWAIHNLLNLPFQNIPTGGILYFRPPDKAEHPWFMCDITESGED